MTRPIFKAMGTLTAIGMIACSLIAQQAQKPLTDADVVQMVKAGLGESVVVATIKANPGNYDMSPDQLIALKKAGVTQAEMDAIVAVTNGGAAAATPANAGAGTGNTAAAAGVSAPPARASRMPSVALMQDGNSQQMPLEKTQLAQTKTKPTSMTALAGDSVVTEAIQAGVGTAAYGAASHINSGVGSTTVQQAGSIFSGVLSKRKPTVTYVWGVPGPASATAVQTTMPKFAVNFANTPGINPDEFAPMIVKLTPAQNTCRLVGATQGKEDAQSHNAADWEVYSSFVEDQVAVTLQKTKPGEYEMSPQAALLPGEYAVVLRPLSKTKKFSGGDVSRAQGDGLMFDSVWSFQVSDNAQ
ncbi:MAG TPA: hypothetical protein VKB26_06305 [Candidatus Acidoferrales bacterium]|nr:hypothetical protein [Candidatus Acidoferrales bacterium]